MHLQIKRADVDDVATIAPLFDSYRIFYKQKSDMQAAEKFLYDRLRLQESIVFFAELNGKAVGFCQLFPIFSSVSIKRTWLLNDLFVVSEARGNGVATALLQTAKGFGFDTHAKWLLLQTGADNKTAQSVYEKNGWQKISDYFYELPLV
jgi:GNAT superfamily N-acetyltransferase